MIMDDIFTYIYIYIQEHFSKMIIWIMHLFSYMIMYGGWVWGGKGRARRGPVGPHDPPRRPHPRTRPYLQHFNYEAELFIGLLICLCIYACTCVLVPSIGKYQNYPNITLIHSSPPSFTHNHHHPPPTTRRHPPPTTTTNHHPSAISTHHPPPPTIRHHPPGNLFLILKPIPK